MSCPEGKIMNPATGRCVSRNGKIGKAILERKKDECPEGKILNPATGRCVSKTGAVGKKLLDKPKTPAPKPKTPAPKPKTPAPKPKTEESCPDDKIMNPATGRCVSIKGKIGKMLLSENTSPEEINVFEKILNLKREFPVDFLCISELSSFIHMYILSKYKNDCHILQGQDVYFDSVKKLPLQWKLTPLLPIILKTYESCAKSGKILCIPLNPSRSHRNMLFLNPHLKTIELFEPHGDDGRDRKKRNAQMKKIEDYFHKNGKLLISKEIKYDSSFSENACPYMRGSGIQNYDGTDEQKREYTKFRGALVRDPRGFCCMWSWLMMEFRLLYPKKSVTEFASILRKKYRQDQQDMWRKFIRGYTFGLSEKFRKLLEEQLPDDKKFSTFKKLLTKIRDSNYRNYIELTIRKIKKQFLKN